MTIYYVDPVGGSDALDGQSEANAFKTAIKAKNTVVAGDTVNLMTGNYNETVDIARSGTISAPITWQALTGHTPVLRGAATSDHILYVTGYSYNIFQNIIFEWNGAAVNARKRFMWVQVQGTGAHGNEFLNCTWRRDGDIADIFAAGWDDWGLMIKSAQDTLVYQCTIYGMGQGVALRGTSTGALGAGVGTTDLRTVIQECSIGPTIQSNITLGTSYSIKRCAKIIGCTLDGSHIEDIIQWTQDFDMPDGNKTNWGTTVIGNVIRNGNENCLDFKGARFITIDGNVIYGAKGSNNGPAAGWNTNSFATISRGKDQACDQIIIRNNIVYDCAAGISLDGTSIWIYNNTLVACNRDYTGNPSTIGYGTGRVMFAGLRHDSGGGAVKNNIGVGMDQCPLGIKPAAGDLDMDYNCWMGIPWLYSGNTWAAFADYAAYTTYVNNNLTGGKEANTITAASVADVLFNSVPSRPIGAHTAYNFGLQAGSPCKATGGPLTTTKGAGTNSTVIGLQKAGYFSDGLGTDLAGDTIVVGSQIRTIINVDYGLNEVTVTEPTTYTAGTAVYHLTATPDRGAPAFGATGGGGGGGGSTGVGAGVAVEFAAQVAGGVQTIPLPSTLANAPVAVKFFVSGAIADVTPANTAIMTIGFATLSANTCIALASEHGQNPSDTYRRAYDDGSVITLNSTGGLDGKATLTATAVDEIEITWSNAPGAAYLIRAVVYDCVSTYSGTYAITQAQNGATNIDLGFEDPDLVFFASAEKVIPDDSANAQMTYAVMARVNDAYVTYGAAIIDTDNVSPTTVAARVASDYAILDIGVAAGALQQGVAPSVSGSTLTMTTRLNAWTVADGEGIVLALKFSGLRVFAGPMSTLTSVDSYTFGDPNFTPSHVEIIATLLEGLGTGASDGKGGSLAIGVADANGQYSTAYTAEDAQTTSDTQSLTDDTNIINLPLDTGADGVIAQLLSFESSGPKFDFTTVTGTAKTWIVVAIEVPAGAMAATDEGYSEGRGTLSLTWQFAATDEGGSEDRAALALDLVILSLTATDEGYSEDRATLTLSTSQITTLRRRTRPRIESRGLTLSVYEPLSQGEQFLFDITGHISDYSHEIAALGGFWSASIKVTDRQGRLEDWYERGLDRRIVAYNPEGQTVFEGFVNSLTLNLAGLTKTVGPVLNVSNRVRLVYSYVDSSGDTSVVGLRLSTDWAEDLVSQARWGVIQRILSSGGATPEDADSLRDDYLRENAQPETDEQQSFGGSTSEPTLDLSILGYVHRLQNYVYNNTSTGAVDLSAKIAAVLAAEPNGYLSSAAGFIAANTYQVSAYDNDNKVAWNIIKELVAKGDAANNRAIFGVYEGRTVHYQPVVEAIDYYQALSDPAQRIATESGLVVAPWDVRPGRWLFTTDFLVGRVPNAPALRQDPRAEFIEGVTYRSPWSLTLRGSKIRRIDQKLAKLGLAGIGG